LADQEENGQIRGFNESFNVNLEDGDGCRHRHLLNYDDSQKPILCANVTKHRHSIRPSV